MLEAKLEKALSVSVQSGQITVWKGKFIPYFYIFYSLSTSIGIKALCGCQAIISMQWLELEIKSVQVCGKANQTETFPDREMIIPQFK